ncbi:MAG: T9SS type A sorting domain-containing protein [Bacteroidota bacterium]
MHIIILRLFIAVVAVGTTTTGIIHSHQVSTDVAYTQNQQAMVMRSEGGDLKTTHIYHEETITIDHLEKGNNANSLKEHVVILSSQESVELIPQSSVDVNGNIINTDPLVELGSNSMIVVHSNLSGGCISGDCGCKSIVCDPPTNGNRQANTNTASTPIASLEGGGATAADMQMHPNPFNENVVINFPIQNPVAAEYVLYDLQGRVVEQGVLQSKQVNPNEGQVVFRGGHLAPGAYLFLLQAGEQVHRGKLIKSE